jgi:Bifunctional DNA primase/polymerase, N-terminal
MDTKECEDLVRSLQTIPADWKLTPVTGNKIPYTTGWHKDPVSRDSIAIDINSGKAQGFGILTGKLSGGIMAIDCDGHVPHQRLKDILESDIPHTVAFTSRKDGRAQYLFTIPKEHWDGIKTKKLGKAKEEGQLEFRWDGCQSVLPPSVHPETGYYQWVNSPDTTEIAQLPEKVLDYLLTPEQNNSLPSQTQPKPTKSNNEVLPPIPIERCLSKEHREALANGVSEPGRDDMGCGLVRDLIAIPNHVPSIEFEYRKKTYQLDVDGNPYQLLSDYCKRCTPPLSDRDCDRIYKSALEFNPSPSIQDKEALTNCLRSWVKENTGQQNLNSSKRNINDREETTKDEKKTAGERLLEIAKTDVAKYFHTNDKVPYADISIDGNRHTYSVRSKPFRLWLLGEYYKVTGKGISSQTLQDTLSTLEAIAIFDGETRNVHLRVAEHEGNIYLDLGTPDWKVVEIDSSGWQLVSDPPVRFWRPDSLLPLPYPVEGGSLNELKELLNVDGSAWILIITFLLFCFCPSKTYPVLVISAHRGSGKTAAAEILKGLIDPGKAALIKLQGDTLKLAVTLSRRWLPVYDNVGHISPDQSDDLCRVATNFGYSTRTLHTTDEETTFEFTRPQIITAIDALVTRDDLADRVLMVQLSEITEENRLPQAELNAKVEAARPRILGALLTALSQTLAAIPETKPETLPRMADYALFAIASEKALGLKKGEFRKTFDESRAQSRQIVLESSPVGEAIVRLMEKTDLVWKGTASELLNELENHTDTATYRSRYFPKASNSLSRQLNRLAPDLKAQGIDVRYFTEGRKCTRFICLEKIVKTSSASSASSADDLKTNQSKHYDADDIADGMQTTLDFADDTFDANGMQTIGNKSSVCAKTTQGHGIYHIADDADDKNTLFSKISMEFSKHASIFKVGDRIRYVGGMLRYKGKLGSVTKVCGDRYICDFDGKLTEQLPREELEAIA